MNAFPSYQLANLHQLHITAACAAAAPGDEGNLSEQELSELCEKWEEVPPPANLTSSTLSFIQQKLQG